MVGCGVFVYAENDRAFLARSLLGFVLVYLIYSAVFVKIDINPRYQLARFVRRLGGGGEWNNPNESGTKIFRKIRKKHVFVFTKALTIRNNTYII